MRISDWSSDVCSSDLGKRTPGVDGITWSTPEAKSQAVQSLRRHGYKPMPLKRIYIPKSNGKLRPLGIPTIKDRAMQALYLLALRSEEHTSELQSLMRISYSVSCLKKKNTSYNTICY